MSSGFDWGVGRSSLFAKFMIALGGARSSEVRREGLGFSNICGGVEMALHVVGRALSEGERAKTEHQVALSLKVCFFLMRRFHMSHRGVGVPPNKSLQRTRAPSLPVKVGL